MENYSYSFTLLATNELAKVVASDVDSAYRIMDVRYGAGNYRVGKPDHLWFAQR